MRVEQRIRLRVEQQTSAGRQRDGKSDPMRTSATTIRNGSKCGSRPSLLSLAICAQTQPTAIYHRWRKGDQSALSGAISDAVSGLVLE
jgi:hypothetical protein